MSLNGNGKRNGSFNPNANPKKYHPNQPNGQQPPVLIKTLDVVGQSPKSMPAMKFVVVGSPSKKTSPGKPTPIQQSTKLLARQVQQRVSAKPLAPPSAPSSVIAPPSTQLMDPSTAESEESMNTTGPQESPEEIIKVNDSEVQFNFRGRDDAEMDFLAVMAYAAEIVKEAGDDKVLDQGPFWEHLIPKDLRTVRYLSKGIEMAQIYYTDIGPCETFYVDIAIPRLRKIPTVFNVLSEHLQKIYGPTLKELPPIPRKTMSTTADNSSTPAPMDTNAATTITATSATTGTESLNFGPVGILLGTAPPPPVSQKNITMDRMAELVYRQEMHFAAQDACKKYLEGNGPIPSGCPVYPLLTCTSLSGAAFSEQELKDVKKEFNNHGEAIRNTAQRQAVELILTWHKEALARIPALLNELAGNFPPGSRITLASRAQQMGLDRAKREQQQTHARREKEEMERQQRAAARERQLQQPGEQQPGQQQLHYPLPPDNSGQNNTGGPMRSRGRGGRGYRGNRGRGGHRGHHYQLK